MYTKEKLQPNKLNAPTLFIGVGGIGSKIVRGVSKRCQKDDLSNIRFAVMDTDVNDLIKVDEGADIIAIQTSSTSPVGEYLNNDTEAKKYWFPDNKMLEPKTVSEGAGQIRAISRLALNATIKQGNISRLYRAIDDLFLKDGGGLKQAIRVVIASTAAGGTGSGIAMETGMLVRHYVKKNYPDAAVMIRGFLVMPGVLDTVIQNQSEKDSLRCNGYATIKEINAFMMKGSGFFDTVPELHRYKDLHISIPSTAGGYEKLSCLPFDFCFLMDRTDSNAGNMITLDQYIEYASQSVYEQNIGPMRTKTSSMEDNILKLCISPAQLGRCRFGGTGASVLRYPYEAIRDYIALDWTRSSIIGSSSDDKLTEEQRKALLKKAWLQFDSKFEEEYKKWNESSTRSAKNEPQISQVYVSLMEGGKEASSGNEFISNLWDRYITPKIEAMPARKESGEDGIQMQGAKNTKSLARYYVELLINEVITHRLKSEFPEMLDNIDGAQKTIEKKGFKTKFRKIQQLEQMSKSERIPEISKNFAKDVFTSKAAIENDGLGDYMLEKYLSINGKAIHPNAARHLLYELCAVMNADIGTAKKGTDSASYNEELNEIHYGEKTDKGKRALEDFQIRGKFGQEKSLGAMCEACDKSGSGAEIERCDDLLNGYFERVRKFYTSVIKYEICSVAIPAIERLIKAYESFYATFESKVPSIEKKKEDIITSLQFKNGDCVYNILGQKKYLDMISKTVKKPNESGASASRLYAKIFESIRNNAYIEERRGVNPFAYEAKMDIFDDIIIEYYKDSVQETCDVIDVKGVLQGIKLEYDIDCAIKLQEVDEGLKEERAAALQSPSNLYKYLKTTIDRCKNLASPNIKKKDQDEAREVSVVACSEAVADGEGIRVEDFISGAVKSASVSKYELRFFRSVYNITPPQIAKLAAPAFDSTKDEFAHSSKNEFDVATAGDYFRIYQKYMDSIGPDCKTSAVITPHVDMRWNSISVMPELDLQYQDRLMKKIHKSLIYGFLYGRINMYKVSDEDPDARVYRYLNEKEDKVDLIVSNGTKCDVLYEVLDALYFDRQAVATIRAYVNAIRDESATKGCLSYKDTEFFNYLDKFSYKRFSNDPVLRPVKEKASLFEIVLLYCNSLPVQNKDVAEMKKMIESIVEIVATEMDLCTPNKDSLYGKIAEVLVGQFNLLIQNYNARQDRLKCGIFSEDVVGTIQRTVISYLKLKDQVSYIGKMEEFEEN